MFAINALPRNPELQKGDILLLQLVSNDARKLGKQNARVEYALIFDHYEEDYDGAISRFYWPMAGKTWRWILSCSEIVITIPFSLENLSLAMNYSGQTNPVRISEIDTVKIMPYLLRYKEQPERDIGVKINNFLVRGTSSEYNTLWTLIHNNDRIVEEAPDKIEFRSVPAKKEIQRNPELPIILKALYRFRCQVCETEFEKNYGKPYAETHHIVWLSRGGVDHSNNLLVVCPNHHRIIHETNPDFDRKELAFVYPNGWQEHLKLKDHFKEPALFQNIQIWAEDRFKTIKKEKTL